MSYLKLPKRVFNSPLVAYTNFADGSHVNLIKLTKPYANGDSWAIHETTKSPFCSNGLFKTREKAEAKYKLMVENGSKESNITSSGLTDNAPKVKRWTVDGYKIEAQQKETGSNYNICLHVFFPDGKLMYGRFLKEGSTDVAILQAALHALTQEPAEIPGL